MDRSEDIKRIKQLIKQVNIILTERWDPIGVRSWSSEIAYTEYESYAPKIAGMIFNQADVQQIASCLGDIRDGMGLGGESALDYEIAASLIELGDREDL